MSKLDFTTETQRAQRAPVAEGLKLSSDGMCRRGVLVNWKDPGARSEPFLALPASALSVVRNPRGPS